MQGYGDTPEGLETVPQGYGGKNNRKNIKNDDCDMTTKHFWAAALVGCTLMAGCASQPDNELRLDGTINGHEGEWIHLAYTVRDTVQVTDSTRIANGAFRFSRPMEVPVAQATLYIGNSMDYRNVKYAGLFIESGELTVAIDTANFSKPEVTGSAAQAESDSLNTVLDPLYAYFQAMRDSVSGNASAERKAYFQKQQEMYADSAKGIQLSFVKSRPHSFVALSYLPFLMGNMTYDELKSIYDNMAPEVKQYGNVGSVRDGLAALERVQPGRPAPLFRAVTWKGDSIGIADLKGKYVLLDFWATWCVPCRKSFPHVKELYKKYHAKGLEVFCVADDDSKPDTWKEVIEKDGIQDFYHVLRGLKWDRSKGVDGMDHTNDISDLYAIHYLPTKYLIDKDGNIIGKFEDEALDAKLKEIFGN